MDDVSTDQAGEGFGPEPVEDSEQEQEPEEHIPPNATPGMLVLRAPRHLFARIAEGTCLVPLVTYFVGWSVFFTAIYGLALGFFAGGWQIPASGFKMPVLILLSLLICLPALFTFNVILGSKLSFLQCAAVLSMSAYLTATILASFGPILLFFAISAGGHDFISVLNLAMCAIAGFFGVTWIWRAMKSMADNGGPEANLAILRIWILIYGFVGAQMSWILRPFIGDPDRFALFRKIQSNFFAAVWNLVGQILSN